MVTTITETSFEVIMNIIEDIPTTAMQYETLVIDNVYTPCVVITHGNGLQQFARL